MAEHDPAEEYDPHAGGASYSPLDAEPDPEDVPGTPQPFNALAQRAGEVVNNRRPVRVLPQAEVSLEAVRARLKTAQGADYRRLQGVIISIERSLGMDHILRAGICYRQDAGRIQLRAAELQGTPKSMRFDIVPVTPGHVFVSGDLKAAHVAIAAKWTGDALLQQIAEAPGAYDMLGEGFLSHLAPEHRRDAAKIAVLATLNGAQPPGIVHAVKSIDAARAFHAHFLESCPGFRNLDKWAREQAFRASAPIVPVPSLTRSRWRWIERTPRPGTILSAIWTVTEAEAVDYALANLPQGSAVVAPMYDGILVECAEADTARVRVELAAVMREGAERAGFSTSVKTGAGATWGDAEGLAR